MGLLAGVGDGGAGARNERRSNVDFAGKGTVLHFVTPHFVTSTPLHRRGVFVQGGEDLRDDFLAVAAGVFESVGALGGNLLGERGHGVGFLRVMMKLSNSRLVMRVG